MQRLRKILWLVCALWLAACSSPTAESYYLGGRQHREADEPVLAMKDFIAATRVISREYTFKARSFSNMATMCRIGERHDLAYALYERSLTQFALARDTLAQAFALNNMAWEQAVMGNKPEALQLIDSAIVTCADTAVRLKVLESRAAACLYAAEYDSVLLYSQHAPSSAYFCMLRAQAYTFLGNSDSALFYAQQVLSSTDNPRYLDDVYFILTHCDSTAAANDIRSLAATRTDIQRSLERNNPEWIEAMLLAEESLLPQKEPLRRQTVIFVVCTTLAFVVVLCIALIAYRRRNADSLQKQCLLLRQSPDLRRELNWNEYAGFRTVCNERLSGIVTKLEQRGLTEREIRLCVLVLIGFSYAEIARILFRAENGIGKDKYVIAKHLGVSVKDLQNTLINIANRTTYA